MKRLRFKGSLVVEATVAFPIFLIMGVCFVLSIRMLTMGAVMDTAVEESSMKLSMMFTRMYYTGAWTRYRNASAGEYYAGVNYRATYDILSKEEVYGAKTVYMDLPYTVQYAGGVNGWAAVGNGLLSTRKMADRIEFDSNGHRAYYSSSLNYMPENMQKGDYERMFLEWMKLMIQDNIKTFKNSKLTDWVFNVDDITITDWKITEENGLARYEFDVNYSMHIPLYWLGGDEWMKTKHIVGYAVVR